MKAEEARHAQRAKHDSSYSLAMLFSDCGLEDLLLQLMRLARKRSEEAGGGTWS